MTTRSLRRALLLVALTIGLLGSNFSAPAVANPATMQAVAQAAVSTAAKPKEDTSMKCANAARKAAKKNKIYKYWICVGTKAKYLKKHKPPPSPVFTHKQKGAWTGFGVVPGAPQKTAAKTAVVDPALDPWDIRCELVPKCTTINRGIKSTVIEANAFYGYGGEVWGGFDVVYYQSFNGASSRYRVYLYWDLGYEIDSQYWAAEVRYNRPGIIPDDVTGWTNPYPNNISSTSWTAYAPSKTTFWSTAQTTFRGKHHDDSYGQFFANNQVFGTTTIHLPNFHCPNHACKYYGPAGPS